MAHSTRLLVVETAFRPALSSDASSPIFGHARIDEGLIQVLGSTDGAGALRHIGVVFRATALATDGVPITVRDVELRLLLDADLPTPDVVEVVDVTEQLDSRRKGCLAGDSLAEKTVLFVGVGSLGSKTALSLAEAGVGTIMTLDIDTFSAANLSRHACGISALGRPKAPAVAEYLEERDVETEAYTSNVVEMRDADLDALVGRADLVVATTDSAEAQFVTNEACVRAGTPLIAAGAYERACGGEVIVVRAGTTPCLACAVGFRAGLNLPVDLRERRQAYQTASQTTLDAEPGLGADIAYLASVVAAYALALLDPRGSRSVLATPAWSFALVHGGSTPRGEYADLFVSPFDLVRARVRRDEPCPVCGWSDAIGTRTA